MRGGADLYRRLVWCGDGESRMGEERVCGHEVDGEATASCQLRHEQAEWQCSRVCVRPLRIPRNWR